MPVDDENHNVWVIILYTTLYYDKVLGYSVMFSPLPTVQYYIVPFLSRIVRVFRTLIISVLRVLRNERLEYVCEPYVSIYLLSILHKKSISIIFSEKLI